MWQPTFTSNHCRCTPLTKSGGFSIEDYPNAYAMYRNEVTLPLHTCLSDEQVEYLLECFAKVLKG